MMRIIALGLTLFLSIGSTAFSQSELQGTEGFQKVRLLTQVGNQLKATPATIRFESDRMIVRSAKGHESLKVFPYSSIQSAEYTFSKGPRYQPSNGAALAGNVFAIPLFVTKVERHRLVVQ